MYECDIVGCSNPVSHPGQLCLEHQQAQDELEDEGYFDDFDDLDEDEDW